MGPVNEPVNRKTKMAELRTKFALFDANGDGVLTRQEITNILTRPTGNGKQMNMKMATDFCILHAQLPAHSALRAPPTLRHRVRCRPHVQL